MTNVAFAIPGNIDLPTGGYAYDRRVLALLPSLGVAARHVMLPGSFPAPTNSDLEVAGRLLAEAGADRLVMVDGLAYGAMPAELVRASKARIVALVHHPLCLEAGLSEARQSELRQLETEALALAQHVIVTSPTTARTLAGDFGVPEGRITVAEPGTDPARRAKGTLKPFKLLSVGSVVPRKGYDVLVEALAMYKTLAWELDIAGSLAFDAAYVEGLRAQIARAGLEGRVNLLGAVDAARLDELYDRADCFVLPSRYEGFGMVLTEALARGLCIVCTTGGAAAETVPAGAAMKVDPPGDARVLAWDLGRAIENEQARKRIADAAWAAAQTLPRWDDTARRIAGVLEKVGR